MALGELAFSFFGGGGLSGALASTGIGGPAAVAVATASVAAAAHAAGVIWVVVKKEWDDHLIWNVATGNNPGEGGNDGKIDPDEQAIDDYLREQGREVKPNPQEGVPGAGRQGDRYVDGILTEYKTVKSQQPSAIVNRVRTALGRHGAESQARHIIVDVRPGGINLEGSQQAMNEIVRKYGGKRLDGLEIIGKGFHITWP